MAETKASVFHPPLQAQTQKSSQSRLIKKILRFNLLSFLTSLSIALIGTIAVLLIQLLFTQLQGWDSYLLFFPAIALISHFTGYRSGMVMSFLSTLLIAFFLIPTKGFSPSPIEALQLLLFFTSGLLVSFLTDIKEKRTEMLNYQERELHFQKIIAKLKDEQEKAKQEIKARDEFLSIASHELKTPLTSMLLQLQTVLHSIRNVSLANFSVENLLKKLDSAEQQSLRLSRMINDLLNVSLMTTGRMELEKEEMNLSETVTTVIDRFSDKAKKENIEIQAELDKNVIGTWDKLRIEQALANLITNAFKYGNKKPVVISVKKQDGHAILTVKDHGIGIPKNLQEKIFARFERAVGKDSYEGLGVGLYITREIINAHHGKIIVDSTEGKGSVFTVHLPSQETDKDSR